MNKIAVFASGSGTNAENLIRYFSHSNKARVSLVLCNKAGAGVIEKAGSLGVPVILFNREEFYASNKVLNYLQEHDTELIVLAGFLWLVPENLLRAYPNRIINIHPALLPGYGGKGMYGERVHKAVLDAGEKVSGITIHLIDEQYDKGRILAKVECAVNENDTEETLAKRIHLLEYAHYPRVVEEFIRANLE